MKERERERELSRHSSWVGASSNLRIPHEEKKDLFIETKSESVFKVFQFWRSSFLSFQPILRFKNSTSPPSMKGCTCKKSTSSYRDSNRWNKSIRKPSSDNRAIPKLSNTKIIPASEKKTLSKRPEKKNVPKSTTSTKPHKQLYVHIVFVETVWNQSIQAKNKTNKKQINQKQ